MEVLPPSVQARLCGAKEEASKNAYQRYQERFKEWKQNQGVTEMAEVIVLRYLDALMSQKPNPAPATVGCILGLELRPLGKHRKKIPAMAAYLSDAQKLPK